MIKSTIMYKYNSLIGNNQIKYNWTGDLIYVIAGAESNVQTIRFFSQITKSTANQKYMCIRDRNNMRCDNSLINIRNMHDLLPVIVCFKAVNIVLATKLQIKYMAGDASLSYWAVCWTSDCIEKGQFMFMQ